MHATFEWDGDGPEALVEATEALPEALEAELESAGNDIGVRIRGDGQRNAPVDEARLQSSLDHLVTRVGTALVRIEVGTNLDYAEPIEKGTDPFFPPPSELRGWARRVLGDADLAFPVARSISETGIEAREYLLDAMEDNLEWAMDRIMEAVENAFEEVGLA